MLMITKIQEFKHRLNTYFLYGLSNRVLELFYSDQRLLALSSPLLGRDLQPTASVFENWASSHQDNIVCDGSWTLAQELTISLIL